jgi:ABC-type branched-subunit amino acid transport system ATPase component
MGGTAGADDALLVMERVSLSFGGLAVLNDVSLEIRPGERIAVIGPNGAGKTSLLNCINGFYHPSGGRIAYGANAWSWGARSPPIRNCCCSTSPWPG